MAATEAGIQVSLKLVVTKKRDKVLFAEAGKDFVDILFSFLTLPLGTILRLVGKDSNLPPVKVGCLSSLYESVANLDNEYLWSEDCKEMLLQPRNPMEVYCRKLILNIDSTQSVKFFDCGCKYWPHRLSAFRNLQCSDCRFPKCRETYPDFSEIDNGFVAETATFIICDDLYVMPNVLRNGVSLLQSHGINDVDAIEEQNVILKEKEVLDLLKCSLFSKTSLTDILLKNKQFLDGFNPWNQINQSQFKIREILNDDTCKMVVRVMVRKSDGKILLAEAEEDFVDVILSFLTFPLSRVLHMLEGCSTMTCLDQLYKSVAGLSSDKYIKSQSLKDNLANPLYNKTLSTGKSLLYWPGYNSYTCDAVNTNYYIGSHRGFAKASSTYLVTDDLVVTPLSSTSGLSYLNTLKVSLCDLEERVINIGLKEGLSILKASLISTSALTNGLNHILTTVKEEK